MAPTKKSPGTAPGLLLLSCSRQSAGGFRLAAARGEDVFGVAVRLRTALEDEVARRLEGDAVERRRHRLVEVVAGVLLVDDDGHPLQRFHHLVPGDDALVQPVRQML